MKGRLPEKCGQAGPLYYARKDRPDASTFAKVALRIRREAMFLAPQGKPNQRSLDEFLRLLIRVDGDFARVFQLPDDVHNLLLDLLDLRQSH